MTLVAQMQASGHEVVQLPLGTLDEDIFLLAVERIPHYGVIGIFRPAPTRRLSDESMISALNRLAAQEQAQPGTALRTDSLTRLNDFLPLASSEEA